MEYLVSSYGNDILKAYSNLKSGDTLTVDVACNLPSTLATTVPFTTLIIQQAVTCTGNDVAIHMSADFTTVQCGTNGVLNNSAKAAVMVTGANCLVDSVEAVNYNTSKSVLGAIFAYNASKFTARNSFTSRGNGNGIRLQNVEGALIESNYVGYTGGTSAEGMTVQESSDVVFRDNTINHAWATGLLVFDQNTNITIVGNKITDASQWPQYAHPAIGLNPNGKVLSGINIVGNSAVDDQAKPTMECLLALQGTGTIQHGLVTANIQHKCLIAQQITKAANSPLVLTDWSAS